MLLPFAMLLAGCQPDCTPFDQMAVDDPDGLLVPSARWGIEAAISDFAAWSGRDGVCVPGIKVVDDRDHWWAGYYVDPGVPIRVGPHPYLTYDITLHELCHAVDELEVLVEDHPRLFHEGLVEDEDYNGARLRRAEGFARLCDDGPADPGLATRLQAECGMEMSLLPQRRFIQSQVYPQAETLPWAEPDWSGAPGLGRVQEELAPAWTPLSARLRLPGEDLLVARWWSPGRPDGPGIPQLLRLEPGSGGPAARYPLEPGGLSARVLAAEGFSLFPGDDGVYLSARVPGRPTWRVDLETGDQVRLPRSLDLTERSWPVAVVAGQLLVQESTHEGWGLRLQDLETGESLPLSLPLADWGRYVLVERAALQEGELWLWIWRQGLARLDLAAGTLALEAPLPPGIEVTDQLPLADGRWALEVTEYGPEGEAWAAVVLLDPMSGTWSTPADLCTQVYDPNTQYLLPTRGGIGVATEEAGQRTVLRALDLR